MVRLADEGPLDWLQLHGQQRLHHYLRPELSLPWKRNLHYFQLFPSLSSWPLVLVFTSPATYKYPTLQLRRLQLERQTHLRSLLIIYLLFVRFNRAGPDRMNETLSLSSTRPQERKKLREVFNIHPPHPIIVFVRTPTLSQVESYSCNELLRYNKIVPIDPEHVDSSKAHPEDQP